MSNKKILWYSLGGLTFILLILLAAKQAGWFGDADDIKVSTAKVKARTIVETVTASGKIHPEKEVKISPRVSGEIQQLLIGEGDSVKVGEKLIVINPDIYQAQTEQREAALQTAKSNLANAKAQLQQLKAQYKQAQSSYKRDKSLYQDGVISESEFESSQSAYQSAKAQVQGAKENVQAAKYKVKSAQARLEEAKKNLNKTTIHAPVSGVVSRVNVEEGERVVGTNRFEGTELLRIANLRSMEAQVDVSENDVVRVAVGDTANINIDAYRQQTFKGIVTEVASSANNIGNTGSNTEQVTNFTVKIRIFPHTYAHLSSARGDNRFPLRPGMSATVDIKTEKSQNALSVPIQSVTIKNKEEKEQSQLKEIVYLYKQGLAISQAVETGIQDNTYIEIKEGLKKGEEVIAAPYSAISKELSDSADVQKMKNKKALWKK